MERETWGGKIISTWHCSSDKPRLRSSRSQLNTHSLEFVGTGACVDADVDDEMVSLSTIGACLVDWTDPRKCFSPDVGTDAEKKTNVNGDVHLEFARNVLERLDSNCSSKSPKCTMHFLSLSLHDH